MHFDSKSSRSIIDACLQKQELDFTVDIAATAFNNEDLPKEWTAYPAPMLSPDAYAAIFANLETNAKDALTRLELRVDLDGGVILYRKESDSLVGIRVTWPNKNVT
jgi:hypothetical protein